MICQQSEANINHASDPMSPSLLSATAAPSKPKLASDDDDEPLTMDNCVALSAYDDQRRASYTARESSQKMMSSYFGRMKIIMHQMEEIYSGH